MVHFILQLPTKHCEAMGHSLVELAKGDVHLDPEQSAALILAERYLAIGRISHGLGHVTLQPGLSRHNKGAAVQSQRPPCPEDCYHLEELLEILSRAHVLCTTPFKHHNPNPWASGSQFRVLQDALEEYLLRHPKTFHFGPGSPSHNSCTGDLDASVASLMWHCCVIILNRTFLPIPERLPGCAESGSVRCAEFPGAPTLFLKERIYRCVSSAGAICEITRDIIKAGDFSSV